MQRVAIVGVGQSVHVRERPDVAHAELLLESVDEALGDAGITLNDIDNAVTASLDFYDGRTIANMAVAEVVGSYLKSESRVCADGVNALIYGWSRIADGEFRLGLVTAHCKESEGNLHDIENAAFDPFTERRLGPDGDVVAGLFARRVYAAGDLTPDDAAELVAAARRSSADNPKVTTLEQVGKEGVLASEQLASPLTRLDKAPRRDGSCAVVVASEEVARDLDVDPVWVSGAGTATGSFWSDRDPLDLTVLETAAARARSMAGWNGDPPDVFEVSAQYAFQLHQFSRALGADPAAAGTALNPSGGWHAGNPITVTGLSRVAEAVAQLRGDAGARQQQGAGRALAHGVTGIGAQSHAVAALEAGR